MKQLMIKIGNFLFKYRNKLFPAIIIALFAIEEPIHTVFGSEEFRIIKDWLAIGIALSGLAIRGLVIGYAYIKRGGKNKKVYADNLVTEGLFGVCRNPLYVGNIFIYIGIFLLHGEPNIVLTGTLIFIFMYQCIIYAEEVYLRDKFVKAYDDYCAEVPRWIPDLSKYRASVQDMRFDLGKALNKDYSTITNTIFILALTQVYKYATMPDSSEYSQDMIICIAFIVLTAMLAGTVRYFKKRKPANS